MKKTYVYFVKHNECILSQQEELVHLKTIPNSLAVFCLATYGEGDPTDNAMEFVDWLKNGDGDLAGLNYAVCTYIFGVIFLLQVYHVCLELNLSRLFLF